MGLSRDVVIDLLPAYLAGEASADTRALVDAWLRSDPQLAERVRRAGELSLPLAGDAPAQDEAGRESMEWRTLRRTRRGLALQRWIFGLACFFTAVTLGFQISSRGGRTSVTLLLVQYPRLMVWPALAAVLCWVVYGVRRGR